MRIEKGDLKMIRKCVLVVVCFLALGESGHGEIECRRHPSLDRQPGR